MLCTALVTSCIGGAEPIQLSETELEFGPEGGTVAITSNVTCSVYSITDKNGESYTYEYNIIAGEQRRKSNILEGNGLSTNDEGGGKKFFINVSPSSEKNEWSVHIFAGNSGNPDIKVTQAAISK